MTERQFRVLLADRRGAGRTQDRGSESELDWRPLSPFRKLTLALCAVAIWCLGAPQGALGQAYEPNDSFITGSGPLTAGITYSAGFETDNDEDYYFFYVPQRTQMFFTLTATSGSDEDSLVCGIVVRQTLRDYSDVDGSSLRVYRGTSKTSSITLDRGKYFYNAHCPNAGETYTLRISPPGSTSTYQPFAAACASANGTVEPARARLASAKRKLRSAKRKLSRARRRRARRSTVRALKRRVRKAERQVRSGRRAFNSANAGVRRACSVPQ